MAVVIKGKSRGGAAQMANYATAQGKNELAQVQEVRGTLATDVRGAFAEMDAIAKATNCGQFLYHAQINPEKDEHLTPEQWKKAVDTLEESLKLEGHQRVVFSHVKDGREHYHVVWNRVGLDGDKLKAVNMGNNFAAHERAAVQVEKDCGLKPLERRPNLEGGRKAARAPETWEYKQAERTALNPRAMKAEVIELRESSSSGQEFSAALVAHGYTLAQGDRRDFVLIDAAGGEHSLGRYSGMKAAALRAFMADIDRERLPSVDQAKETQREGRSAQAKEEAREERAGMRFESEAPPVPKFSPCDLGAVKPARAVGKIAAAAADVLMATVGTLLMGMAEGKPKKITAAEYLHNVKARQEYNQQRAEEARREEKREASLDALRGGRPLEASMLQNFNRQDLEQIKASGAIEGVQQILHEQERQREERERERTRER